MEDSDAPLVLWLVAKGRERWIPWFDLRIGDPAFHGQRPAGAFGWPGQRRFLSPIKLPRACPGRTDWGLSRICLHVSNTITHLARSQACGCTVGSQRHVAWCFRLGALLDSPRGGFADLEACSGTGWPCARSPVRLMGTSGRPVVACVARMEGRGLASRDAKSNDPTSTGIGNPLPSAGSSPPQIRNDSAFSVRGKSFDSLGLLSGGDC